MTDGEFDFGTTYNEDFFTYIQRIENQVDAYLKFNNSMPEGLVYKIVEIFRDTCFNTPLKTRGLLSFFEANGVVDPTLEHHDLLCNYIRDRLLSKTKRKEPQKLLINETSNSN